MKTCELEGCNKRHEAKGLCDRHYRQHHRGAAFTDDADLRLKRGKVLGSWEPYKP